MDFRILLFIRGTLNDESEITQRLRKLLIDCKGKLSKLKTNLISVDFFLEVNEHSISIALYMDSISMSEFCLHKLDILPKQDYNAKKWISEIEKDQLDY